MVRLPLGSVLAQPPPKNNHVFFPPFKLHLRGLITLLGTEAKGSQLVKICVVLKNWGRLIGFQKPSPITCLIELIFHVVNQYRIGYQESVIHRYHDLRWQPYYTCKFHYNNTYLCCHCVRACRKEFCDACCLETFVGKTESGSEPSTSCTNHYSIICMVYHWIVS